nr:MAG TPA: hypothetical protein [Caudoviricetes sp.]
MQEKKLGASNYSVLVDVGKIKKIKNTIINGALCAL